jgi:N-acetylmuramic acid 6-phosphate etherase
VTDEKQIDLDRLTTEARNSRSLGLDTMSAREIVEVINAEDAGVATSVAQAAPAIAKAIDIIAERMSRGGRLIYVGAGTSGRLGILDAVECPPTFSTEPSRVIGLIAGGSQAFMQAVEGAEDSPQQGAQDLEAIGLGRDDAVVGVAASGRTPYVIGALDYARKIGAATIGFSCNANAEQIEHADHNIITVTGPEVLSGSTRMKAGTATKMVLNMLSTGAMVRQGKAWSNLMVDVRATNHKLVLRARRIMQTVTGCSEAQAKEWLARCGGEVKTAIAAFKLDLHADEARRRLAAAGGHLRKVLENQP